MINFTNKFDNKCENLGFFIPEDKLSLKTSKIDEGKKDKINKFLKRIEKNKDKKYPLYDEKGKISLQTLKALSLEPWETFYFEGKCQVGTGI